MLGMNIKTLVATYEWPSQTRVALRYLACCLPGGDVDDEELETSFTLSQILRLLEVRYEDWTSHRFLREHRSLLQKFEKIGLTALDSIVISPKTVTLQMLKQTPKAELLQKDARVLGTLSNIAAGWYRYWDHTYLPFPTVAELLKKGPVEYMSKKMRDATKNVLIELGLREEGKLFFRDTRSAFVDELIETEKVSEEVAAIIAKVAEKRGWKKFSE